MSSNNECVWFDLFSSNTNRSAGFYTELFHWSTQVQKFDACEYIIFKSGDKSVAGLTAPYLPELNNKWLAYVNTPSLSTATQKIKSAGGSLLGDVVKMPQIGSWQVAKDPEGVIFCAFEADSSAANSDCSKDFANGEVGSFCWHELMCHNKENALNFYNQIFGWTKAGSIDMGPMGVYQMYQTQDKMLGGMMDLVPPMPPVPYWLEYVQVKNVDTTYEKALALGAKPTFEPMNVNNNQGRIAGFADPEGALFAVHANLK